MCDNSDEISTTERTHIRLSPLSSSRRLLPLRRAEHLTHAFLYWIPVRSFPASCQERVWLTTFVEQLSRVLEDKFGLDSELFFQMKFVYPSLSESFLESAPELIPILGLGRRPGVGIPPIPTLEDLQPLIEGKKKFAFGDYVGDYCYWFLGKNEKKARELFLGYGGLTHIFLPSDPKRKPIKLPIPPKLREHPAFRDLFARIDPDQVVSRGRALSSDFLKRTIELYGADIPKNGQTMGIPYILPLL